MDRHLFTPAQRDGERERKRVKDSQNTNMQEGEQRRHGIERRGEQEDGETERKRE